MTETRAFINSDKLFWVIAAMIIIIMPSLSSQYGMSGDEWLQMDYGRHIWNYFAGIDKQALDYTNLSRQYSNQEYYGGLFDFSMEALHRMLPTIPILHLRHFFNALLAALMMVFTGLLTFRLSAKWVAGTLALLFILFSPRLFGEGMNNPKDIPFACGFVIAIYSLVSILHEFPRHWLRYSAGLAAGCGISFGVRPAGFGLLVVYIILFTAAHVFFNKDLRALLGKDKKSLRKLLVCIALAIVAGYLICLATWPYGQQSPIGNLFNAMTGMSNRDTYLRNLFEGALVPNTKTPWYYEPKWILISTPLVIIAGLGLFLMLFKNIVKQYGKATFCLLIFASLFPLLYAVYKHSTLYDTWRHMFFVYPFWVTMAVIGWDSVTPFIKQQQYRWVPYLAATAGLGPAIIWTIRSHPNQYVYFNETVGGLKGAYGYYETDYYQNSGLQAANWVKRHVKKEKGKKIIVRSNMAGFEQYFLGDSSWLSYSYGRYEERNQYDWDYYITYSRYIMPELLQDDKWPPQGVIYKVEEDGVPLSVILKRTSKDGIKAYQAYKDKDFATAVHHYSNLVKQDSTDPYVYLYYGISLGKEGDLDNIDKGIACLDKANELQPGNPQFYNELSKLYRQEGDLYNEQKAKDMANSLVIRNEE